MFNLKGIRVYQDNITSASKIINFGQRANFRVLTVKQATLKDTGRYECFTQIKSTKSEPDFINVEIRGNYVQV